MSTQEPAATLRVSQIIVQLVLVLFGDALERYAPARRPQIAGNGVCGPLGANHAADFLMVFLR